MMKVSNSSHLLLVFVAFSGFLTGTLDALIIAAAGGREAVDLDVASAAAIAFSFSATLLTFAVLELSTTAFCIEATWESAETCWLERRCIVLSGMPGWVFLLDGRVIMVSLNSIARDSMEILR